MLLALSYQLDRLSSRLHRSRLALHARGWRGLLERMRGGAHGATAPMTGSDPHVHRDPQLADAHLPGGPRVLMIDVTTPRPDRDSGSVRAFGLMALLVEAGYRVEFLPDDGRDAGHYSDALRAAGVQVHLVAGTSARIRWLRAHAPRCEAVIVSRYHLAESIFPLLRRIAPASRRILDTVDLHHLRELRESDQRNDPKLRRLAAMTRKRELAAVRAADVTWVVSAAEQTLLAHALPGSQVRVVSNIQNPEPEVPGPERRRGVVFVGGAAHPPNLDAVAWLLDALLPAMRQAVPDLELHLVGEGLEKVVPRPPAGVIVHGFVPDLRPLLRKMRVGLAPLRFGAGVKGKVNQGMAHGLPMVVTPCAAEGMHLRDGAQAFIAQTPEAFAEIIARLDADDALWLQVSHAAREHVAHHFSATAARSAVIASLRLDTPA